MWDMMGTTQLFSNPGLWGQQSKQNPTTSSTSCVCVHMCVSDIRKLPNHQGVKISQVCPRTSSESSPSWIPFLEWTQTSFRKSSLCRSFCFARYWLVVAIREGLNSCCPENQQLCLVAVFTTTDLYSCTDPLINLLLQGRVISPPSSSREPCLQTFNPHTA